RAISGRALDRDEFVGLDESGRDRTRDLVTVDLAERGCLDEVARLAIGGRHRGPAACPARQTAIDAIAVGIVGDDEDALFSLRGDVAEEDSRKGQHGGKSAHGLTPARLDAPGSVRLENACKTVAVPLTRRFLGDTRCCTCVTGETLPCLAQKRHTGRLFAVRPITGRSPRRERGIHGRSGRGFEGVPLCDGGGMTSDGARWPRAWCLDGAYAGDTRPLTRPTSFPIVRRMYGFNAICGSCRKIIR